MLTSTANKRHTITTKKIFFSVKLGYGVDQQQCCSVSVQQMLKENCGFSLVQGSVMYHILAIIQLCFGR